MDTELKDLLRLGASSRRHLVQATAIAGGLVGAGMLPSTVAGISLVQAAAMDGGDLGILNYALTLEHLEDALYRTLLKSKLLTERSLLYATAFAAHEHQHVLTLTATITKLGGTPVAEQPSYKFPMLTTAAQVVTTLAQVEDLGASAYLGAAPLLQNPLLLAAAVEIHTVEAQHATAWRFLAGMDPLPFAFAPPCHHDAGAGQGKAPSLIAVERGDSQATPTTGVAGSAVDFLSSRSTRRPIPRIPTAADTMTIRAGQHGRRLLC